MKRMFLIVMLAGLIPCGASAQEGICAPPGKDSAKGSAGIKNGGKGAAACTPEKAAAMKAPPWAGTWTGVPGSDIVWVTVTSGVFEIGSKFGDSDEHPPHQVVISGFEMAATEVTVAQYRRCVEADACTEPDEGPECTYYLKNRDDFPVNCVDWEQARAYSKWVGGRLPTEAEWEYAARYGRTSVKGREMVLSVEDFTRKGGKPAATDGKAGAKPDGKTGAKGGKIGAKGTKTGAKDGKDGAKAGGKTGTAPQDGHAGPGPAAGRDNYTEIQDYAWFRNNSGDASHRVATKKPTDIGLYDMLGSMMEWVADWFGDYGDKIEINPTGPADGFVKVLRGGAYATNGARVRASVREHADPETRGAYVGFRPVRPIKSH